MCGITGYIDRRPATRDRLEGIVAAMAASLHHRGPDDGGLWTDPEAGVALGHRRLSIIDLSPLGHQPMVSADGRYIIVFNGEIYNFKDIWERLSQEGVVLRGRSDTEVLLEAVARWGVPTTLAQCEGMFAMAFWDRKERRLILARDRAGIKPLYWGLTEDGLFMFGSELKALRRHPGWQAEIDRDALSLYMRFGYIPAPHSIYRRTWKLEPGGMLTYVVGGEPRLERYWDLRKIAEAERADPAAGSEEEQIAELEHLMRRSIKNEMVSDVPLGAFLSGGIDSSLVTALMQAESSRPVKTFTIGFRQKGFDEAVHAAAVARHLGTEHTELYVSDENVREVIPYLPVWYDEPFADSSQIPTHLVSRLAREHVTVALSGDGGDELFGGYPRYRWGQWIYRTMGPMPMPLRRGAGAILGAMPDSIANGLAAMIPARVRPKRPAQSVKKLAQLFSESKPGELYRQLVSIWEEPDRIVRGGHEPGNVTSDASLERAFPDHAERMMLIDTLQYLPDDILAKVDRASMAVSLEVRVPLLNHRIAEYAWRLPLNMKLRGNTTKWIMRQILYRYVPPELIERPKQGFSVPLDEWLRGPLQSWTNDLLSPETLSRDGYFDPAMVGERWREHREGRWNYGYALWNVMMFQSWLARERSAVEKPLPQAAPATVLN